MCTVSHSSGQFMKRIMILFPAFTLILYCSSPQRRSLVSPRVCITSLLPFIRQGTAWIIINFVFCPEMRETFQGILLQYYDYPEPIRRSKHSTNLIERMNKGIRRRINIIGSLPSEESAMKIIYLRVAEIDERWSQRMLRGFYKCIDGMKEMFQERYP